MKHIEISLMKNGELSIDGQTKSAGNLATYENLIEKVKEALEDDE